ncbi:MAG: phenylalanine--tRNA ligase subunit beta, partial [Clostridiales bacterium]|nr:phenylalanine--tRNA ligase subunit beta [Clostridiales bacterium]
ALGVLGQIHPAVAESYDIGETYAAELDFFRLLECRTAEAKYVSLPKFPAITRDIALVCDTAVTVAALTDAIKRGGGTLLREVALFDIYTGSQVPQGKKSVAFSLKLRSDDATLTDADADAATKKILELLEKELNAVIR